MSLRIIPNTDLEPQSNAAGNTWKSVGDDPNFEIRFDYIRKPFIVISLKSDGEKIDPRIYINAGGYYSEKESHGFALDNRFIFLANVGSSGWIRSLRIDPCSFPCRFDISMEAFSNRKAADIAIAEKLKGNMDGAIIHNLGNLPRFRLFMPTISFGPPVLQIEKTIKAHYALGKKTPLPDMASHATPWLSIVVPVYNAPKRYLDDLLKSFLDQGVPGTELILSDDSSTSEETKRWYDNHARRDNIKILRTSTNGGIATATNTGLAQASGTWVAFLDHDDVIAPHALKVIGKTIVENPNAKFIYSDEVVVDDQLKPMGLTLKPAYDPILLTGVNYINHFSIYRRDRLSHIGNLRTGFDGSQDYDLLLRYLEGVSAQDVFHLPYPAYWWRRNGKTYSRQFMAKATTAARKAINESFARKGVKTHVDPALTDTLHRVMFENVSEDSWPMVSIIIPSKDSYPLISRILNDLFERTDYPNFEVIVIDNGTSDEQVLSLYQQLAQTKSNFSYVIEKETFNFSRAINRGITRAKGEHFLLLNNDVEVMESFWLKEMVSCLNFEGVGIVGAKLLYPNNKIQHAGVVAGFGGLAGHWYLNQPKDYGGPMSRLHVRSSMTCVTGAVMLISGSCARAVGLWNEEDFAVAYNDVDYCLRAYKAGFRTLWTPFSCLYHHESVSRGSDIFGERKRRFNAEKENLKTRHGTADFFDPAANPSYDRRFSTPQFLPPEKLAAARRWFQG
ncbi:glycosyltransferase [Allorhizobium terrae]|uniref:Glycosyltransferase n=1 Tax=Allorhizobium terrae TaxID=1848972 RepID=A0A4S3ZVB4_9HYPH|nr:glycosyltransferase [Allorhizobium terrae]THF49752.1 glycosyltransferase [Allorhizobium terrae]